MHIIAVNQHGIHGAVAKWCNRKSPPPAAEPETKEGAVREVSPQLVTRLTANGTLENWALRDLMRKGDERLRGSAETEKLTQVCEDAVFSTHVTKGQLVLCDQLEFQGISSS